MRQALKLEESHNAYGEVAIDSKKSSRILGGVKMKGVAKQIYATHPVVENDSKERLTP